MMWWTGAFSIAHPPVLRSWRDSVKQCQFASSGFMKSPGSFRNAYGFFGVSYSASFWNGFQTVS